MKHCLTVLACEAKKPDIFRAICGYESENGKEFTSVTNPSMKGVTCPKCLEKLGKSIVIVADD
jgi:hypothetical protein